MDRSLRFRVYPRELNALFRLAFAPAPVLNTLASLARSNSPDHNAKGTQSPHNTRRRPQRLPPLVGTRFQVLFHSPPGVLFTFPSRYSCTIGRGRVFSLGGWSPRIQAGLLGAPTLLRYPCHTHEKSSPTGLSPAVAGRSRPLRLLTMHVRDNAPHSPTTPDPRKDPVWALPRSLAATWGISLDFSSCRYLDVSVPCVGPPKGVTGLSTRRVAPFGYPWITGCVLLPMAFRSLPRPSSPARAQASPVCPYCA
jgi:hypothetical protein